VNDDARMQAFLVQLVQALVERPAEASVAVIDGRRATRFEIRAAADDRGQVIGKDGTTIRAIRTLAAISAHRRRRRFEVELPD